MARRLLKHHAVLGAATCAALAALYWTRPYPDAISRASFATAYPALALLAATLLLGPWRVWRGVSNPVSNDLRRDVGIWAGSVSVAHAVVGQCVHLRGRPWLYYVYGPAEHHRGMRHDLFGLANYTGLLGTLVVIALLATSNDFSLRRLGAVQWKKLQRWNYAVFALVAVHAFAFQGVEKQKADWVMLTAICVGATVLVQAAGAVRRESNAKLPA
jgi:sulfoxide reductase heme-binding subunit YedZ